MKKILKCLFLFSLCLITMNIIADSNIEYSYSEFESDYTQFNVKFLDGASSDKGMYGLTSILFKSYYWGSMRYKEDELYNHLDFFGGDFKTTVSRQSVDLTITGMKLDLIPKIKKMCHMFKRSSFENKIINVKVSELKNLLTTLEKDDELKFDRLTLMQVYNDNYLSIPIEGLSRTVSKIKGHILESHSSYFNDRVKKKVHFMGSKKSFEELKSVLESECRWGKTSENIEKEGYSLNFDYSKKTAFFVSNQIRKPIIRLSTEVDKNETNIEWVLTYLQQIIDEKAVPVKRVYYKKLLDNLVSIDYEISPENVILFLQALSEGQKMPDLGQSKKDKTVTFNVLVMGKNADMRKIVKSGVDLEISKIKI